MAGADQVLKPVANAKPSRLWWAYEATMAALALVVVWLLTVPDEGRARVANVAIWRVFVVDYGVRLAVADDRRRFVRSNIPDLIAILPLDFFRVARLARLARLTRLLRAGTVLWRITKDVRGVLGKAARISKLAIDAGLDERRVKLAERQGEMLAQVLRGFLQSLQSALVAAGAPESLVCRVWSNEVPGIVRLALQQASEEE